jgi:hypothetical protein
MMCFCFFCRNFWSVVFFICFGFCVFGADSTEVEWKPNWKVGDQFTVEMVKERMTGKTTANKGHVFLDMLVQEKGENFYILHCTYGKFELEGSQKDNPLVVKMMNLSEGLCLKIKTDEDGLPQELINANEIVEKSKKSIDLVEEFMKDNKLPQAMIEQIISPVRAMYEKPETVKRTVLNEISLFFLFCSAKLESDKVSEFDESLPNPFQGESLPAKGTILLKEFDKQTGIAAIEYCLTIDKKKAAPILFASMKKMMPQVPDPTKEKMPQLDIADKTLYRIDTKKGWSVSVEHSRNIKMTGQVEHIQNLRFKTIKGK